MRELTSVVTIESLCAADNSDNLSICRMQENGWQVVVKNDEFKVGEKVVFIEIDAMLPACREEFEFLTKGEKDYRLRSVKLRGNLSQGLIIKIPDGMNKENINDESLGIVQYEPQIKFNRGETKGGFPVRVIPRTDQTRIQNVTCIIPELQGKWFWETLKMDGTSFTCGYLENEEFTVCSHNCNITRGDSIYWQIANKYELEEKLKGTNLAIQGEVCAPNIQKNKMGVKEISLFVFDVYNIEDRRYLDFETAVYACEQLGLTPVAHRLVEFSKDLNLEDILAMADEAHYANGAHAEGLVFRSFSEDWHRKLGRFSFKAISNNYLLKEKE